MSDTAYTLCPPATRTERQQAGCEGKHRFDDPRLARRVASRSAHTNGDRMSAYRCRLCGGWHIGSNLTKRKRRKP